MSDSKLRTGQFQVDTESNQITFIDVRWYANDRGDDYYPSVSTVLDAYPKSWAFYEWLKKEGNNADKIRDAAGETGSIVHQLTEKYDLGEVVSLFDTDGKIRYRAQEWAEFEKYVQFRKTIPMEVLSTEENMVSDTMRVGGTLDRRVNFIKSDGSKLSAIADIKTSNLIHPHYWLQLEAYRRMYMEKHPDDEVDTTCIIWLNAKTRTDGKKGTMQGKGWQVLFPEKTADHYWKLFNCTYDLWYEENQDTKPRNTIYTLSHKIAS
jgi:hypothetical protein